MVDQGNHPQAVRKLTCLCAPTTHAGSFRCRLHRASDNHWLIPHVPPNPSSSLSPKPSPKPSSEYHGIEKPAREFIDLNPMLASKPLCGEATRTNRVRPSAEAATPSPRRSNSKMGFESNQQRHSGFISASPPPKAGIFAAGNCQSMLRKMHSESPPPIFSL